LGKGLNNEVFALAIYNGNLIAGGIFDSAGGQPSNSIAQWNGSSWSSLGGGIGLGIYRNAVTVLAVYNGNLITGGIIDSAGGKPANNVAEWNGTSWSTLVGGLNNWVEALITNNGNLYAGGLFDSAGGVPANHIAEWNGAIWSALDKGLNNNIDENSFGIYNGNLYVGGGYDSAGGILANNIAEWGSPVGINELTNGCSLNIYPNPGNGRFTFIIKGNDEKLVVKVYNIFGEMVYEDILAENASQIDLRSQSAGVYLYKIVNPNDKAIATGKLIIE
jgi:hypothetical protein